MNRILMIAVVGSGLALFGTDQTIQAGHGCGYGGGYSYAAPVYSYAPAYSYAAPAYSYAPNYQSAYVQPSYGYSTGISLSFGHRHNSGYGGGYYGGHGGHYSGHSSHYGGHGSHFGGHQGGHHSSHHGSHH